MATSSWTSGTRTRTSSTTLALRTRSECQGRSKSIWGWFICLPWRNELQVLQSTVYLRLPNGLVFVTKTYCDVISDVLCRYPFDVQKCKMDLSIKKGFAPFTKLLADQLRYAVMSLNLNDFKKSSKSKSNIVFPGMMDLQPLQSMTYRKQKSR